MQTRPLRVLLAHPGATWSTYDVYEGLLFGLRHLGCWVQPYRLDQRIISSTKSLWALHRVRKREDPETPKPTHDHIFYDAGIGILEAALRIQVDVVVIVSAMYLHPNVLLRLREAHIRVFILFTESPYDIEKELLVAPLVDGGWTNERTSVADFRKVNPHFGYLPHAWHPDKHHVFERESDAGIHSHDVVFVGTGWGERIAWFNAIDWTGIDLGLYGTWDKRTLNKQVRGAVVDQQIDNERAAALYRRAKIGINLYRKSKGWSRNAPQIDRADSLSPRAYELAACGSFHISEYRAEVREVFGGLVPTFSTPTEAAAVIRLWLNDPEGRARVAEHLPACVAEASWVNRAKTVLGDLQGLLGLAAA